MAFHGVVTCDLAHFLALVLPLCNIHLDHLVRIRTRLPNKDAVLEMGSSLWRFIVGYMPSGKNSFGGRDLHRLLTANMTVASFLSPSQLKCVFFAPLAFCSSVCANLFLGPQTYSYSLSKPLYCDSIALDNAHISKYYSTPILRFTNSFFYYCYYINSVNVE